MELPRLDEYPCKAVGPDQADNFHSDSDDEEAETHNESSDGLRRDNRDQKDGGGIRPCEERTLVLATNRVRWPATASFR